MPKKSALALCGCVFIMILTNFFSSSASADAPAGLGEGPYAGLRRLTLENGCVVLILPSRKASTVAVYVAVRSGSADESRWMGMGLSHFVEHMFFKGTPTRDKGTIERQVREMGGYINAYTSHDNTVFYLTTLSRHTESAIDLLYDAAFHPLFDTEELEKERQVILAEQRMNEDRLSRKAMQTLWELTFLRHPYRHPIIGYPEIFRTATREDLAGYFKSRYTPNQMVVCVVGDIDADQTEKWIRERFEKEPRAVEPPVLREPEPVQASARSTVLHRPAQHARLDWGYPGVPLTHPDAPALDVLAQILGDGASSRLFQDVKEKARLALEIGASSTNLKDAGVFEIDAQCLPKDADALKAAVLQSIEELKRTGPSKEELNRAKKQTLARHYGGWESHGSLAHDLVTSEIYTGDSRYSEQYLKLIERVEAEDVIRAAKRYLDADRLNEVRLLPEASSEGGKASAEVSVVKPKIERIELSNGLKLLVLEDPSIPVVHAQVSFRGGTIEETAVNNGVSALAADLLLRGTRRLDQRAIADHLADWGADAGSFSGNHTFGFTLSGLSEHSEDILGLMAEMIVDSVFDAGEWGKAHEDQLQAVLSQKEDIYSAAGIYLSSAVYGNHPYHQTSNGTEASLALLTRNQTYDFYKKHLRADQMVIGVAGDVRADEVKRLLERAIGKLPRAADSTAPKTAEMPTLDRPVRIHEPLKREQAVAMLAFRSIRLKDPRRFAFQVLNAVMSGSAGRLYQNIRGVHGMSYVINSGLQLGEDPGHMVFYAGVKPGEGPRALDLLAGEAARLREGGITDEELRLSKEQLIGNHEHSMESPSSVLQEAVTDEIMGLGFEEMSRFAESIRAVTKDDVEAVIRDFIDPNRSVGLVVAPEPPAAEA
jgi:zinc protease